MQCTPKRSPWAAGTRARHEEQEHATAVATRDASARAHAASHRGSACYAAAVRRWDLLLLLYGAGCSDDRVDASGPDEPPSAAFEAVCGSEGPHRLLLLREGEHAYGVERVGDEPVLVSTFFTDPAVPLGSLPPTLDLAIHAVGPCGEAPVEVARGLSLTARYEGVTLACSDGGHGAWVIDPLGAAPPRAILAAWCPLRATDVGMLAVEAEPDARHGTLVLLRDPAEPDTRPEALAEGIRAARNTFYGPGSGATTSLWAAGREAVALSEDGAALRVDLDTGQVVRELEGVRELRVSSDGRAMVWQALTPAEGDPDTPLGPVRLRDREAGTDAFLLDTHLEWTGNPFVGSYLVLRDDVEGVRVFRREGPEPVALPEGTDLRGVLDDDVLWLARKSDDGLTEELRWRPGEATPVLLVRHAGVVSRHGDDLEIFDDDAVPAPSEGSLDAQPLAGGPLVHLADHVHASRGWLDDGRLLTIVGEDATGHGSLLLLDPEGGERVQIDARGFVQSPRLSRRDPLDGNVVFASDGGVIPGERGVYRAAVPR